MRNGDTAVYRIANRSAHYAATDLSGTGAARHAGRWNPREVHMVCTSTSRALAALETLVHRNQGVPTLPLKRYLVEVLIPKKAWQQREVLDTTACPRWNSTPPSHESAAMGAEWIRSRRSLVAVVPSIIVPEEDNVLLNPTHEDAQSLKATAARAWEYDPRL